MDARADEVRPNCFQPAKPRRIGTGRCRTVGIAISAADNPYQRGPEPHIRHRAVTGPFAIVSTTEPASNGFGRGVIYYPTDTSQETLRRERHLARPEHPLVLGLNDQRTARAKVSGHCCVVDSETIVRRAMYWCSLTALPRRT